MRKAILLIALLVCAPAVIALANPASEYCVAEGYKLTAKQGARR